MENFISIPRIENWREKEPFEKKAHPIRLNAWSVLWMCHKRSVCNVHWIKINERIEMCMRHKTDICFAFAYTKRKATDNHAYWCGLNVVHVFLVACTASELPHKYMLIQFYSLHLNPHIQRHFHPAMHSAFHSFCLFLSFLVLSIFHRLYFLSIFSLALKSKSNTCV